MLGRWCALALVALMLAACGPGPPTPNDFPPRPTDTPPALVVNPTVVRVFPTATATLGHDLPGSAPSTFAPPPPTPTNMPAPALSRTPTSLPPPTLIPTSILTSRFASGGLGLTQSEWEATYGPPTRADGSGSSYANDQYLVVYRDERVVQLERRWGEANPQSRLFASGVVQPLLPRDARFIRSTTTPGSGGPVDWYHSDALATLFPASRFVGGAPGDFSISYRLNSTGQVTAAVVALGATP